MNLYIIPTPVSDNIKDTIPIGVLEKMHGLKYFIVERARTARRYIKASGYKGDISALVFFELDKHNKDNIPMDFFKPALEGHDMGLMSEAGIPGIADPGAKVVSKARDLGLRIIPLTGPSSIFLALAASGLNGQHFTFEGYLPVKPGELKSKLQQIQRDISNNGTTHIFIETPYRNNKLMDFILKSVAKTLRLCIACDITGQNEYIDTKPVGEWLKGGFPDIHKKTCIFLLGR